MVAFCGHHGGGPILWDLDLCSGLGGRYLVASDSMVPGVRMVYQ